MNKKIHRAVVIFFILAIGSASANELFRFGTPYIRNFTKKEYQAGNKNWSLTQDEHGFIYAGNTKGLLQFDGFRWNRFDLPNGGIVRSVMAHNDTIYSGSLGDFGYWVKDENFNVTYTSLASELNDQLQSDEEIWWIVEYNSKIIFQSFATTFIYDGKSVKPILINQGLLLPPHVVGSQLLIQILNQGIFQYRDDKFLIVEGSEKFQGIRINSILPFSDSNDLMIATEDDGFYRYQNNTFFKWDFAEASVIQKDKINRGIKFSDKLFAIGTILGGIYIVNEEGVMLNQINRKNGLNNNTVLSLFKDKAQNLWVGLDNGIDLLKVNSPVYYNTDKIGRVGSVYAAAIHKNVLYLGTNRGVFYSKIDEQKGISNNEFALIPESQGQVWSLTDIDGTLFCGHNNGTFIIRDFKLIRLSNVTGGYEIKVYPYDNNLVVQGAYNGLSVYRKVDGSWQYSHSFSEFTRLSNFIEFERENVLWVSHTHRGLFRLELNDDLTEITEIRGFSQQTKTYVNKINKKLVISSDSGFYYYDDIQNSFFALAEINESLGHYSVNAHVVSAERDNYWIFKDSNCAMANMTETSVNSFDDHVLEELKDFLIPGFEDIYVVDSTFTLIFLDNGFAIHDNKWNSMSSGYDPKVQVRDISFENRSGAKYSRTNADEGIPYGYNTAKIAVSHAGFFKDKRLVYRLDGYDFDWHEIGEDGMVEFQNLPKGDYNFKIATKNNISRQVYSASFEIDPPWYKSTAFRLLYIALSVLCIGFLFILNKRKRERLHAKMELEQQRKYEKRVAENEKELAELRNQNLRKEIRLKNSKLAKSTFSLIHKNNALIRVKQELIKIKDELGVRFPTKHFDKLTRQIDHDLSSEKDWRMFEQSFSEVHEDFLKRLRSEYPDLTTADMQICAYLKMNLSSKEIASLLNISTRGVEIRRYRLRKKLNMEHDTNLVEFIIDY